MPVLNRVSVTADDGVLDFSEIDDNERSPDRPCVSVQLTGVGVELTPVDLIVLAEQLRELHYKITRMRPPSEMRDGRLL